jgi:hypothetical protein
MAIPDDWAPDACTLPTAERPLRVAEFDDLFTFVVRAERREPQRLDLVLRRIVEAPARDLARRESECCSFFRFEFESIGDDSDDVVMHIGVPPEHVEVIDAIEARASGG